MAWEEPRKTGMIYRRLGNSGLHVSAIALGGWLTYGGHVEDGMVPLILFLFYPTSFLPFFCSCLALA
jgi:hypothetical protein